jgi:hypothetical protein
LAGGAQVVGWVQVQLLKLALEMTRDDYGIRHTAIHENCLNHQFAMRKIEHCRMVAMRASSTRAFILVGWRRSDRGWSMSDNDAPLE